MVDSKKNQALRQKVKELEEQAAGEQQNVATSIEKLKQQHEAKAFKDRQQDQELHLLCVNYSYLDKKYKSLRQKYKLLEADKVAQHQKEAIREETENRIEALQSKIKELLAESASAKESSASLSNVISTKVEEVGKLEARVSTLTMDAKRSFAKIQELETARDALDKALQENTQSLCVKAKELGEMQSQYNTEKKRLEDKLCAFRKQIEMLNEKIQKEEGERTTLYLKIKSVENTNLSLRKTISTKLEEIGRLEALVSTLTMDAEKSSVKIQELETARDALDKALEESTQSLSVKAKELDEMQSQYNTEKKRLEDELCAFGRANEMLNEKLQKEINEKEAKRKEEEEKVRSSVQPNSNTPGGEASSAIFTTITCKKSICKYIVKAGFCCHCLNVLDISKYNVLAVVDDYYSVYLYSETSKREEKLCICQYGVRCLAWNQQGKLLAIGGTYHNNTNDTIQVWDIPNRRIIKRLKFEDNNHDCHCLDWRGDTITAGTDQYIYQWYINDQDNDQDSQGDKALLPRKTVLNEDKGYIKTVQWSNCESKLATITEYGDMCVYDEEFKVTHQRKAKEDYPESCLQWCPWDNQVIATLDDKGHLKIWRVQQGITPIKKGKYKSRIVNIKWIPSKKAIITAHINNQLLLWEYPSLSIIRIMNGHTRMPMCLALNADKSAIVSKSDTEMIFWKPFDQF